MTNFDTDNREQQLAWELIAHTNCSFFLTGRAGTGKTTFLRRVQDEVPKQFITLAPTGVAAILAEGETIHSFFGLPLEVCTPGTCGHMSLDKILALLHADTLIIDEASMVRCDIVDAIDCTMRTYLRSNQPFGGKQVVWVGDMFQLPPVVRSGAETDLMRDIYHCDKFYFFKARALQRQRLVTIEFKKNYRQEDAEFRSLLDHVRMNRVTSHDMDLLNTRVTMPKASDNVITLVPTNRKADEINTCRLNALKGKAQEYAGEVTGKFDSKKFPVSKTLQLKVGAQVMFTRNDPQRRWANGTIGTVSKLTDDAIEVQLPNGQCHAVPQCTWDAVDYAYNHEEHKMEKDITGRFKQYPLKLAWAITIHKSQGMTFDNMCLNLSSNLFADGQLYVALSRVRTLGGLFLSRSIPERWVHTDPEIIHFASHFNDAQAIASEIESGKAVYDKLRNGDDDEAARQYLLLASKYAAQGHIKEAVLQAQRMMDTVICDDELMGCINRPDEALINSPHRIVRQLAALLCLYGGDAATALRLLDEAKGTCGDALYLKSRCLACLNRFAEADEVNFHLFDHIDWKQLNAKYLYMIAMLNEQHTQDPGLSYMQLVINARPKSNKAVLALRGFMLKRKLKLTMPDNDRSDLEKAFNSPMSNEDFAAALKEARHSDHDAVKALLGDIKRMDFSPYEPQEM